MCRADSFDYLSWFNGNCDVEEECNKCISNTACSLLFVVGKSKEIFDMNYSEGE